MFAFRVRGFPSNQGEVSILFDNPEGPRCLINFQRQLTCNTGQSLDVTQIPTLDNWILFTYTTDFINNQSFL